MTTILGIVLRAVAIACFGVALLWWSDGFSEAVAGEPVFGKAIFLVTPTARIPLGLPEDAHVMVHSTERGTPLELTGPDIFKDCTLLRTSTCDLVRGRGTCFGYQIIESSDGDRLLAKFSGMLLPEGSSDKNSSDTVVTGTWVYVKGTGKFADIKGGGNYRGRYISSSEYALEWSGELVQSARNANSIPLEKETNHVP